MFTFTFNCFITYTNFERKTKECDNYIICSINHEVNLQKVSNSTLSPFDEKRCHINEIESTP